MTGRSMAWAHWLKTDLAERVEVEGDAEGDAELVGARVPPADGGAALVDLVLQPVLGEGGAALTPSRLARRPRSRRPGRAL